MLFPRFTFDKTSYTPSSTSSNTHTPYRITMALSNGAIIVIVIVCCGAFVCCLGAVGWVYRRQDYDQRGVNYGWRPTNNQNDYMREIRSKNQEGMFHAARYHERALSSQPSRSDFTSDYRSPSRSEAISPV
ncbi:hypothetical protein D6C99_02126 [Aureobasidium pullulans]|nr:hypothetical protein D6C99_02126 [Aureobasidium pullulans]